MSDDLVRRLRDRDHVGTPTTERNLITSAADRIAELEVKLATAVEALDEAIYMLAPDERDMEKKAGIYRIVTAYEELQGVRPMSMAKWVIPEGSVARCSRCDDAEAKLAKAVARLEWVRTQEETPPFISMIVADTLKELKEVDR